MMRYLSKSFLLLIFGVVITCVIYPLALWVVGQTFFPFQSNGSMIKGPDGKYVGSKLIAQPFTKDGYFWPRPSAASYDATASASSSLAASNYALRDRVARSLGPVATYKSGPKAGQLVAPDVESWFKAGKFQGKPGIVAQWADLHNSLAQAWVKTDTAHGDYVNSWAKANPGIVAKWIKENPATPKPQAADLAVVFFEDFSAKNPGKFLSAETKTGPDGKPVTIIEQVDAGADIQSTFFDMWRQDHPDVSIKDVPGDYVTTSGSGLDPDITLENALFQLPRVVSARAKDSKLDPVQVRNTIEQVLRKNASSPLDGLAGEKFVNVLEVNLALDKLYSAPK
ncbi:MAG: potassium-transporting ATPase subunit C [Syntrophobacteraceae bacterium]|nr:potassium-transporting ATPase subunit C [Syntrophobacteraceae bacterium]